MLAKIATNPSTKHLLGDPSFMAKLQAIQKNPTMGFQEIGQDPRFMSVLAMLLGIDMGGLGGGAPGGGEPMQTDEPVCPTSLEPYVVLIWRRVCILHLLHHPETSRKLKLHPQRLLLPPCRLKRQQQIRKKQRATKHIKLVRLMWQSRITRKHGNCTRISRTSTTSPPRTLKRATIKRVLKKHKGPSTKEEKSAPISN